MKPNFLSILLIVYALALQTIFIYYYYFYRENFVTHKARLSSRKNSKTASNSYSTNDNISEFNFPKKYPNLLFCKDDYKNNFIGEHNGSSHAYIRPASNETHELRIIRGLFFFFQIENSDYYILEFKWLYRSWIEMQKYEPAKWRTDLLVFIESDSAHFDDVGSLLYSLNCTLTNIRNSDIDPPMCTLISYKPLKKRQFTYIVESWFHYDPKNDAKYFLDILNSIDIFNLDANKSAIFNNLMIKNYPEYDYVDSIIIALDGYEYFKKHGYNFVIRSDMDVFLTPMFGKWLPRRCNDICVGMGGYSDEFNMKRLKRVAKRLNLRYAFEENFGSTWYSTPEQIKLVSFLTLFSMAYLASEEFTTPEKQSKLEVQLWPYWHYGVLSMYGLHLAFNHLTLESNVTVVKLSDNIDYPTTNEESIDQKLHLHAYHDDEIFSKFHLKDGKYDNLNLTSLRHKFNTAKYYPLIIAVEAKKMHPSELNKLFREISANKQ